MLTSALPFLLGGALVSAIPIHLLTSESSRIRAAPGPKGVSIQMFQWNWDSIAAECTNFIGPAGYGFVQVSPPNEHIRRDEWWADYQSVSYIINSKHGNRNQFQNMVTKCREAGVGVIVDAIWNHMTGQEEPGQGWAGSDFSHYNYPGIYGPEDFHQCGTPGGDIHNWYDRNEVQNCELFNLADLKTENENVRSKLVAFSNDLLSMGVAGFRVDASKHMPVTDIQAIISRLDRKVYFTHEVVYEGGDGVTSSEYIPVGDVQEFRYTTALRDAFTGNNIASLRDLSTRSDWLPSQSANVFVANHDRERGGFLNYRSPQNMYTLANVFSLSYPYGSPTVLSSYEISNNDHGAPNGGSGTCVGNSGANGWNCQHRWQAIAGMVGFYNTVAGTGMEHWTQGSNSQIAFCRGSAGFVAINNADSQWDGVFETTLPDGTYCDVTTGKADGGSCTGLTFAITGGRVQNLTVAPRTAMALHIGAKI